MSQLATEPCTSTEIFTFGYHINIISMPLTDTEAIGTRQKIPKIQKWANKILKAHAHTQRTISFLLKFQVLQTDIFLQFSAQMKVSFRGWGSIFQKCTVSNLISTYANHVTISLQNKTLIHYLINEIIFFWTYLAMRLPYLWSFIKKMSLLLIHIFTNILCVCIAFNFCKRKSN